MAVEYLISGTLLVIEIVGNTESEQLTTCNPIRKIIRVFFFVYLYKWIPIDCRLGKIIWVPMEYFNGEICIKYLYLFFNGIKGYCYFGKLGKMIH